jgi:hypothetical protein
VSKKRKRRPQDLAARKQELESQVWAIICESVAARQDEHAWLVIPIPGKLQQELAEVWRKLERAKESN